MSSMDEAVEFFRRFAAREYEAEAAFFGERDEKRLQEVLAAYNRDVYEPPMHGRAVRPRVDEAFFARADQSIAQRQPRAILRVDRWPEPGGDLFAAAVSSNLAGDTALFSRYFARQTPRGLRIVSRHDVCVECGGTGEVRGRVCAQCAGTGWEHFDGAKIEVLEVPAETRAFDVGEAK
jgi:hypothetical protein